MTQRTNANNENVFPAFSSGGLTHVPEPTSILLPLPGTHPGQMPYLVCHARTASFTKFAALQKEKTK